MWTRGRKFDSRGYASFLRERRNYYRDCHRGVAPSEWQDAINTLRTDGIVTIPNFLPQEHVACMVSHFPEHNAFSLSTESDASEYISDAHLLPEFQAFFHHPGLADIARSYIGVDAVALRQKIEIRTKRGSLLAFDRLFHMDTWKHRLKAFLLLHDIGVADAPLVYLRGSHRGSWRWPEEFRMHMMYKVDADGYAAKESLAYLGCYLPYEIDELKKRFGFHEYTCVAEAGTLVLFDARGLHRASELQSSFRKLLISYWIRAGHHI